jgi:hypothetical protein
MTVALWNYCSCKAITSTLAMGLLVDLDSRKLFAICRQALLSLYTACSLPGSLFSKCNVALSSTFLAELSSVRDEQYYCIEKQYF